MEKYKGYSFIFIVLIIALILVCYKTLIVSNENWKLNQDHLINNNLAGYVNIENCEIQK